eukprot:TRINITY_DN18556_c0_g1_i1.p1 TRINITY_DN18556_c0_g1~~TRINITY_DN18556_c0_g1_i1.p1  ORF type:complete len:376 (-),score=73.36 TRINITY_DN18556_c0_g1_i1:221-1318(-)
MACDVATHAPWTYFWGGLSPKRSALSCAQSQFDECRALARGIEALENAGAEDRAQASETLRSCLEDVLRLLEGPATERSGPSSAEVSARLLRDDLPLKLVTHLDFLDFEARKYAMRTFTDIVKHSPNDILLEYMKERPHILQRLLDGSGNADVSLHCSSMLRACTRSQGLVAVLLEQDTAKRLIDLAGQTDFDISSEAFASLRELLMSQPAASATHLQANFESFFEAYHVLLRAEEAYTTRRRALRLLSDVLTARPFMAVMVAYVSNDSFLQLHMNLLRDESRAIQLDTFHVFKIFAANPNKPRRVQQILHRNKDRLVKLLESAVGDKASRGDASSALQADLSTVIRVLASLQAPPKAAPSAGGS